MNHFDTAAPHTTPQQLEATLAGLLTTRKEWTTMSAADHWLASVLMHQPNWNAARQAMPTPTTLPEPSLLTGLLILQRQATLNEAGRQFIQQQVTYLYNWLMHRLATTPANVASGCALTFHYLSICLRHKPVTDTAMASLIGLLQHKHPATNWNPGLDLTTEVGTTGWLLTLLKTRSYCANQPLRIHTGVSNLDPYLDVYIRFLHTHQIPADGAFEFTSLFPVSVQEKEWNLADEQSWSQGDLGHLLLLHEVASLQQQDQLTEWANRIGGYLLLQRQLGKLIQKRVGLLNGMAGLSLLYRRLFTLTQQQAYLDEGHYWLGEVLRTVNEPDFELDNSFRAGKLGIVCTLKHWLGQEAGLDLLHL